MYEEGTESRRRRRVIETNVFVIFGDTIDDGEHWRFIGFHCDSATIGADDHGLLLVECDFWTEQQCLVAQRAVKELAYCLAFLRLEDASGENGRRLPVARVAARKHMLLKFRPALETGEIHPITGELVRPCGVLLN